LFLVHSREYTAENGELMKKGRKIGPERNENGENRDRQRGRIVRKF
jgi:hypothetical protein